MRLAFVFILITAPLCSATPDTAAASAFHGQAAAPSRSEWSLSVSAAAADGSRSVLATLPADAPIESGFAQVTPKLILRYRSGETVAYVACDKFLGDDAVTVVATFGAESPVKQTWQLSSDGRTAFVPGDALAFIRHLQKVASFSIRIEQPKGKAAVAVSFSPKQTDLVIKALLAAGVKYGG